MTDITLKPIKSGYNLNKINDNFQEIESNINSTSIQSTGGNNVMSQELDMNGERILNIPKPTNPTDVVRLKDIPGADDDGKFVIVSVEEEVTLIDGQTTVVFSEVGTASAAFYISNGGSDRGRLTLSKDFSIINNTTIELVDSCPAGTTVTIVRNEQIADDDLTATKREVVLSFDTLAEAKASTKLAAGDSVNLKERTTGNGGGAMWDVVLASTVVLGDDIVACIGSPALALALRKDTRLDHADAALNQVLGAVRNDITTVATRDGTTPLTDVRSIVRVPKTDNKANPNQTDEPEGADLSPTPLASSADFLHRLRNTGSGATSGQSPSALGTFAVSPKWDVEPSTQYTISMHSAPLGFQFYQVSSQVQEFDANGEWIGNIVPTSTSFNSRQATFTTTAGAAKISINLRNPVDFSNSKPMTESSFGECVNSIMLNLGTAVLPFSEFSNGDFTPTSSLFDPIPLGDIEVTRQETYTYVRTPCQQSPDKDVVWRILANHGENIEDVNSRSGVVDFYGVRFIDKTEPETKAAFNLSTDTHSSGIDESCPIRYNEMFQAGGHGAVGYTASMVTHGKANVDVGSIWSDGTDEWVLTYINSVNGVTFLRKNTGTTDKWVISATDFSSSTLTHISGATNTANIVMTSSAQYQVIPIIRDYLVEMRVDNVGVTTNGTFKGQRVVLSETYSLLNVASQQAWLISDVGNSNPDYTNNAITEQVRFYYEYEWNEFGAMSIRSAHGVKEDYRRSANNGYWGALQLQRLSLTGDSAGGMHSKAFLYIPEIAPVSGLDFENVAEVTSNAIDVVVPASSCDNPSDPSSHFSLIGKDGANATLSGQLFGYSREEGLGVPANRASSVNTVFKLSSAEKNYPFAIDSKAGDALAGQADEVTAFRAPFLPTDTDLTIPAVIVTMSGKTYCYITAHQNLTGKKVAIPSKYNARTVTVVKSSSNVTVKSGFVSEGFIEIDVINNYGDVVLKLGS